MPIELDVWRIDEEPKRVTPARLGSEERLESFLERDPGLLGDDLLVIGRQVTTGYGKQIDLLALNAEGQTVVVELKRNRTPRDVVAQLLDYGSWVQDLAYADLVEIYDDHVGTEDASATTSRLEEAYSDHFGGPPPESLNESHRLVVVASELDPSTERIVNYLTEQFAVPINAVFFRYFQDADREYLTRTWLKDPHQMDALESRNRAGARKREPWNGQDFYVSFGDSETRRWEDAVQYGFVSGGGGAWYSRTLDNLFPGSRVFVCIPQKGYVGVGTVTGEKVAASEFTVENANGDEIAILDADLHATTMDHDSEDPDKREYVVPVDWIRTRAKEEAIWEKGMFANQNTVSKLRNQFTLERLVERFDLDE